MKDSGELPSIRLLDPAQSDRPNADETSRTLRPHSPARNLNLSVQRRARIEVELAGNEDVAVGLKPRSGQPRSPGEFNLSPSPRRRIPNQP